MASVSRILRAEGASDVPKFECDSRPTFGSMPKRLSFSAAIIVISASSSAVGSMLTWVSTRKIWRPGRTSPFMAA
ncbi:hypothetical protein D3C85_1183690 [compost metagenome]